MNPNIKHKVIYDAYGKRQSESYLLNNTFHNEDGPAVINYYHNETVSHKFYFANGLLHRSNGPALIKYCAKGSLFIEKYYLCGKLYNDNGPAIIEYDVNEKEKYCEYWLNDVFFNKNEFYSERITLIREIGREIEVPIVKLKYYDSVLPYV